MGYIVNKKFSTKSFLPIYCNIKMPCCCRNLQVALNLGILLLVVELIDATVILAQNLPIYLREFKFREDFNVQLVDYCIEQFVDTFFNVILVIGAKTKKSTAILIWIVLAIIKLTYTTIATILLINQIHYYRGMNYDGGLEDELHARYITLGIAIATILFYIWAMIAAKNAIREITDETNQTLQTINPISPQQPRGIQMANFWKKLYCCFRSNVQAAMVLGIINLVLEIIHTSYAFTLSHYVSALKWEDPIWNYPSKLVHQRVDWKMQKIKYYVLIAFHAFFNGILVFGAKQRNGTAILVWMVLAVIRLIFKTSFYIFVVIFAIKKSYHISDVTDIKTITIGIAFFVLYFWAMVLASNARKEIAKT